LIEQLNPGVEFDWPRILKGQGTPPSEPRPPVDVRRSRPRPGEGHASQSRATAAPVQQPPIEREAPEPQIQAVEENSQAENRQPENRQPENSQPVELPAPPAIPAASGPAVERIGAEGVQRLRARYAEISARIAERIPDPARRDELRTSAGRLDPDSWLTPEDVTRGLEEYETIFASLRQIVGHKRRRRRRGRREGAQAGRPAEAAAIADELDGEPMGPEEPSDGDGTGGGTEGSGEL
jgi:hypothetical protein